MANNGNLYWDISFVALYRRASDCGVGEKISVGVNAHDFMDAYNKAERMYDAILLTRPDTVFCASVTLRDDGTAIQGAKYRIYQTNYINEENVAAFFSAGADKCLGLTWRG